MIEKDEKKLAIVCSGGGMGCAYAGGVLCALSKELHLTSPKYIITASGSAGATLYYLTGQLSELERIWKQHLSTTKFISFARLRRVMDIDYLVDVVFNLLEPLTISVLPGVDTQFYIPAMEVSSQNVRYFSKEDNVDSFELLRAAKALPIFYGKATPLLGGRYVDSGLVEGLDDLINKARSLNPTHVLVIDVQVKAVPFLFLKRLFRHMVIKVRNDKHSKNSFTIDRPKIFTLFAKNNPASLLTRDKRKLAESFDLGYGDTKNNKELLSFLSNF